MVLGPRVCGDSYTWSSHTEARSLIESGVATSRVLHLEISGKDKIPANVHMKAKLPLATIMIQIHVHRLRYGLTSLRRQGGLLYFFDQTSRLLVLVSVGLLLEGGVYFCGKLADIWTTMPMAGYIRNTVL